MDRLYKKLEEYGKTDYYPFHMPGHKRNMDSSAASFPFDRDITEIHGFDNLHHAEGVIRDCLLYTSLQAIAQNVSCIIVGMGIEVTEKVIKLAHEKEIDRKSVV